MKAFWRKRNGGDNRLEHVEGVIDWLVAIGIIGLAVVLFFGLGTVEIAQFGGFVLWAMFGALASLLVGAGLGLLFGLPTVRRVEITRAPSSDPVAATPALDSDNPDQPKALADRQPPAQPSTADDVPLGYAESTNLEHVADWLTKIIVGLTLTQYASWEQRFAQLSYDLSFRLLGGPACDAGCAVGRYPAGSTIPGGVLMIFYAVLGFLLAYLWMRGYFITEMETAKRAAKEAAARKLRNERRAEEAEAAKALAEQKLVQAEAARIAADQARSTAEAERLASEEGRKKAEADKATAEAERAVAEEAFRKAEAEAAAEREKARTQGTLQERFEVQFTPEQATEMTQKVTFTAEKAQDALTEVQQAIAAGSDPDDPWRGQFGSLAEKNGLALSAKATQSSVDPSYYDVNLTISAIDPATRDSFIGKSARLFLHPTFGDAPRTVYFGPDGVAPLQLLAYGAFTVGAIVEDGTTLELNLATIPNVDAGFLSR